MQAQELRQYRNLGLFHQVNVQNLHKDNRTILVFRHGH